MKKIAAVLLITLSLGGCSTLQGPLGSVLTSIETSASISNPVTPTRLNQLESAAIVVFSALNVWKASCINGTIPASCKEQIAAVQTYTRQIPPYLNQLRSFVKNNDQINAVVLFNNISAIISNVRAQAAVNGVAGG